MTAEHAPWRPRTEPARTIYDALVSEAEKRNGRSVRHWIIAERKAVWSAARDYAQQHGLPVPTLADVEREESMSQGHIDYAAKVARGVAELLTKGEP